MRVGIEKRYIDSYKKIAREANKALKKKVKISRSKYEKALFANNISVENKKKKLAKYLHNTIISSFSIYPKQIKKKSIGNLKKNVLLIRAIIHKINSINNYLEESFLKELGIIKKPLILKAIKSKKPEKFLQSKRDFSKDYVRKIEHTVYNLMHEIIFFDEKLLKGYKGRGTKIIEKEKLEIKDIDNLLKTESVILDTLEAKIPPPSKVKGKLFSKEVFNKWMPLVFALLASFEAEYKKEQLIFSEIKKNNKLKNIIESKIRHIVKEKEKMFKMKEKRALSMRSLGKIGDDYRQVFHEYVSVAGL